MRKTKAIILAFFAFAMLALTACRGAELPEGMDEATLFAAGRDVTLLLVNGDYEAVYALLREDQRALFTVDDIRTVVENQLDGAGIYKQIEDSMMTAQTISGERYGIAVLYCEFSEDDVLVRISFDAEMNLVGFSLDRD